MGRHKNHQSKSTAGCGIFNINTHALNLSLVASGQTSNASVGTGISGCQQTSGTGLVPCESLLTGHYTTVSLSREEETVHAIVGNEITGDSLDDRGSIWVWMRFL